MSGDASDKTAAEAEKPAGAAAEGGSPVPGGNGAQEAAAEGTAAAEASGEEAAAGKSDDGAAAAAAKPKDDWRDARLRVETAKRREAEAKLRAFEEKASKGTEETPAPGKPGTQRTFTEEEVNTRASAIAAQNAQWKAFNDACVSTAEKGRTEFSDFDARMDDLKQLRDPEDPVSQGAYNMFLAAAMETGEGPRILRELGGDLNEAQRILGLPPVKMAVEMTKLALAKPREGSKAPKPITAIGSRGAAHVQIDPADKERGDNLSTAEWMKRREAQVKEQARR